MKRMKRKILLLAISLAMIIPVTLASIFAEGEAFNYSLNYVLSDDKTYATVTLELLSTEDIQYTSITDINGEVERLEPINEVTREYEVSENKEYTLLIGYTYQTGEEQSQELKITVSDIELPELSVLSELQDLPEVNTVDESSINEEAYIVNDYGLLTILYLDKLDEIVNIVMPDEVNGIPITTIAGGFVSNSDKNESQYVKSIKLPSGVKWLQDDAFIGFTSLSEIELPDGLEEIGIMAFNHSSLKSVSIPDSVTKIGNNAFSESFKLEEVKLSSQLKTLTYGVFSSTALKRLTMSDKLETIENDTFENCQIEKVMILSEKSDYDDHMNELIQAINNSSNRTVTKYLGHTLLEAKQDKVSVFGEKVYNLDELIYTPTVYKYEADGITKSVSHDFTLSPSKYTLTGTPTSNNTRLDEDNKKLYIGADENSTLTLSATYEGKTVSTQIEAKPNILENIAIKTNPNQLEYRDGDTFNPDGLKITVTYNSGEIKTIDYNDEKENFIFDLTSLKTGDKTVKMTYQGKEATINIETLRQPILADASKNVIEGIKENYTKGETVSFEVKGDCPDNNNPVKGDTRYIPLNWKTTEIKEFGSEGKASFPTLSMIAGKQILTVTFQLEEYDGTKWISKGTDSKSATFEVKNKVEIIIPNNPPLNTEPDKPIDDTNTNKPLNTEPDKPSKDKEASFQFTTTKNGITYDANGNVVKVDKYGNIIKTGDNHYILLYAGVMVISGMIGYRVYKKRKIVK